MTRVCLVRHAEPDWAMIDRRNWPAPAADYVPLTQDGIKQAAAAGKELAGCSATVVVSSPMPRASQTGAIIARECSLPLAIEFDLHEWLPHENYRWVSLEEAQAAYAEMIASNGERAIGNLYRWEPLSNVRQRSLAVLRKYSEHQHLIAVCHEIVIFSLTGFKNTSLAGVRYLDLEVQGEAIDKSLLNSSSQTTFSGL